MKQHTFSSYDSYLLEQQKLTRRKMASGRVRPYASVNFIRQLPKIPVERGLCHGVRTGDELGYFSDHFGGVWIGTEIYDNLCDDVRVVHADFNEPRDEWVGQFDIVYSNSLDHSPEPETTVKVWLDQLTDNGRLLVEWSEWHDKLGAKGNRADCFAASLGEYFDLLNGVGKVVAVFLDHTKIDNHCRRMLVCSRR